MKTRIVSLLTALAFVMLAVLPACAIVLDGYNKNDEYGTSSNNVVPNKAVQLFDNAVESGNVEAYWAQAYVKTEDTLCYIIFNVLCDGDVKNSKAGVTIEAEGETLKADMTQEQYDSYNRNKLDFAYVAVPKAGGFTVEVRINFKNGIGDGKKIAVRVTNTSGEPSAVKEITVKKSEPATVTTTEKTTKPTTEKTTKEKTTKTTTEKTTKEKTTKPTTEKTTKEKTTKQTTSKAAKATAAPETKAKREITHRAVTTTTKKAPASTAKTTKKARTPEETTTKFRSRRNNSAVTSKLSPAEIITGETVSPVTYTYITEEYTTEHENTDSGTISTKQAAGIVSAILVVGACALGTAAKKDKDNDKDIE